MMEKMGADSLAENAPKFIRPISPIVWDIVENRPHRTSVVRDQNYPLGSLGRKIRAKLWPTPFPQNSHFVAVLQ